MQKLSVIQDSEIRSLKEDISFIKIQLSKFTQARAEIKEWIPRLEFMELVNIGSTKFNIMRNQDKLITKRVSSKLYVHRSCVDQYFSSGTDE